MKVEGSYRFIGGDLISTDGVARQEHDYRLMSNEYVVEQSTSKWIRLSRESFAAGALARINNNFKFLNLGAQDVAASFGLQPVTRNPYMNNIAQLVECMHVVMESIALIDELMDSTWQEPRHQVTPRSGFGGRCC